MRRINLPSPDNRNDVAEGGCGVLGIACSVPIKGKYLLQPMLQMHNRGNGKGGGIAAVGLSHSQLGVPKKVLEESYLLQVAYLDPASRNKVEAEFIIPSFDIDYMSKIQTKRNFRSLGLEVRPPEVWRYFVRADPEALKRFVENNQLDALDPLDAEDEFVYRNSFALNKKFYASLGEKKAFVVSHGKNQMVLKIVGYAENVLEYYMLEDIEAHVWIGHQRYPTKGKVWHPGGSHPFIGLHDALVHNGDFANYYSITDYLKQRSLYPLFLTDTEVAVLYWDLLTRLYKYPLEYAIEAIAPTTERDFEMLPQEKKKIYRAIQVAHMHGSPDGPWFFIIARNEPRKKLFQLIGITDTSMLRPQVFALQEGEVKIGLIASEKQAIDAMVSSLAQDDPRFYPMADQYWYARGGSYTDGGAFIFTIDESKKDLVCTDKFGQRISTGNQHHYYQKNQTRYAQRVDTTGVDNILKEKISSEDLFACVSVKLRDWKFDELRYFAEKTRKSAERSDDERALAVKMLSQLIDRRYDSGDKKRSDVVSLIEEELFRIFDSVPEIKSSSNGQYDLINFDKKSKLRKPLNSSQTLVIDVRDFKPEGDDGTCQFLEKAYQYGWRNMIAYNFKGQRNFGAGLIARDKVRIDVYGRAGDCLAAFADGPEFYVHESAQDSVAYCFKSGKLVIYGDAGKAFEYGAKGGVTYILGDLNDRPLINSVGSATALINGSCKDYMGESCMAANGFIVLNGVGFDQHGRLVEQETPYHGGNLFPLAAAGSVYLRDPRQTVGDDQFNGAGITSLSPEDWQRVLPLLRENEQLFGISVDSLLTVDGVRRKPQEVYRKVVPIEVGALRKYEVGM
jgi:glutamate synthase domain-containing protein 1/glutamate synthase domain-containing protein 3